MGKNGQRKGIVLIGRPQWRCIYQVKINYLRSEGRNILYVHDTWIENNLTLKKCWGNRRSGKDDRAMNTLIIIHSASLRVLRLFAVQDRWSAITTTKWTARQPIWNSWCSWLTASPRQPCFYPSCGKGPPGSSMLPQSPSLVSVFISDRCFVRGSQPSRESNYSNPRTEQRPMLRRGDCACWAWVAVVMCRHSTVK